MIPLIVGITGHRDLAPSELGLLRTRLRECFQELQKTFPGLPLQILTPLAAGADQLAAEVAIELDLHIVAVLPMPREDYRADFDEPSLARFEELLAKSEVIELPVIGDSLHRDKQYIELAGYLAAHSHLLVAIWDGEETAVPGGTSAVIHFHQHDTMIKLDESAPLNPIDFIEDESDLVFHIACSRAAREPNPDAGITFWRTRDDVTPKTPAMPVRYRQVFKRMIEFNDDIKSHTISINNQMLTSEEIPERVSHIMQLFGIADSLATHYQARMMAALRWGYTFILLAGLSFIVYADLYNQTFMIYTYVCFMILFLVVFRIESMQGWQRKYQDYRVLAEALRVQFYWQLAGVHMKQPHRYAHDNFHERRELHLGWIRNVMRVASLQSDARLNEATQHDVDSVIEAWIRDSKSGQVHYYQYKAHERAARNKLTELLESISLAIVLTIALLLIFLSDLSFVADLMIAVVGFIPFVLAVRQNFAHRIAEKELISQYQYFYRIFSSADELIKRTERSGTRQEILRALGNAALDESSQWILRQRERPVSSGTILG